MREREQLSERKVFCLSSRKDGVDRTVGPETVQPVAGSGETRGQVWNAKFEMLIRHPGGDESVQWTCESGIQRRGLGWRLTFWSHQCIKNIESLSSG